MKKFLASFLVIVMLLLSLASCGYSIAKDDMNDYASFSKADFEAALLDIKIEDGKFTTDAAIRHNMVLISIYEALGKADTGATNLKTGTPGEYDYVYYCFYATATIDGEEVTVYTSNMDVSKASKVMVVTSYGEYYADDDVAKEIAEKLSAEDFKFDGNVYATSTSATVKEGDIAYVTYTVTVGDGDPVKYTKAPIVIGAAPADGAKAETFESYLCGKTAGKSITKITFGEENAEGGAAAQTEGETKDETVTYSNIKIDWVITDESIEEPALTVKTTPFDEETLVTDVAGKSRDLNGVELTYNIFPVHFTDTIDYTSENLLKYIVIDESKVLSTDKDDALTEKEILELKEDIMEGLYAMILGEDYSGLDENSDEDKDKIAERAELLAKYKYGNKSLGDVVGDILKAYADYQDALEAKEKADKDYSDKKSKYDEAVGDVTEAEKAVSEAAKKLAEASEGDEGYDELKKAHDDAVAALEKAKTAEKDAKKALSGEEESVNGAKATLESAKAAYEAASESDENYKTLAEAYETAKNAYYTACAAEGSRDKAEEAAKNLLAAKEAAIDVLLNISVTEGEATETVSAKMERGYRIMVYNYLQDSYNEEIKTKLATEIYYFLTENVEVTGVPSELVEDFYEQMYEAYEYSFYNEYHDSTNKITNYVKYDRSFKKFLIAKVAADIDDKVTTFAAAKTALKAHAKELAEPVVELYLLTQTYGKTLTEAEYEEFKEEVEYSYYYYYYYYYGYYDKSFNIESVYGKNNILFAAQFDKLMDWILEFEESEAESVDENGYTVVTYDYKSKDEGDIFAGVYSFGTPASESADEKTEGEESAE